LKEKKIVLTAGTASEIPETTRSATATASRRTGKTEAIKGNC